MMDWWGPVIHEYAGTKARLYAAEPKEWLTHQFSLGVPLSTAHATTTARTPPGQTGTIYFSDGGTFEYYNDPDKTADSHPPSAVDHPGRYGLPRR